MDEDAAGDDAEAEDGSHSEEGKTVVYGVEGAEEVGAEKSSQEADGGVHSLHPGAHIAVR